MEEEVKKIKEPWKRERQKTPRKLITFLIVLSLFLFIRSAVAIHSHRVQEKGKIPKSSDSVTQQAAFYEDDTVGSVPEYTNNPVFVINDNMPDFTDEEYDKASSAYIKLSDHDIMGRCQTAEASLGKEMLDAAGEREDISKITPTGWMQASYPKSIEGDNSYLYQRSHLIAHMFAGSDPEIDGKKNLITATAYCNNEGMLAYSEKAVKNWLLKKADGDRVLYRVTPLFKDSELVARGVHIQAADVGTKGSRFHINVFCYNVQPGIYIDYQTGYSFELLKESSLNKAVS